MMKCPYCDGERQHVRQQTVTYSDKISTATRHYECNCCEAKFQTLEVLLPEDAEVNAIFRAFSVIEQQYKNLGVLMRAIAARTSQKNRPR